MKKFSEHTHHWSENVTGPRKLIVCGLSAALAFGLLSLTGIETSNRAILSWDVFCLLMLGFSWLLFFTTKSNELCIVVAKQDDGLKVIFTIVTIAISFSVFGALILMVEGNQPKNYKMLHTVISLSPVFLSWLLLHTMFTIRYAHLYHDHNLLGTGVSVGGIDFPTDEDPDYLDFAYFSFVIGMTFQVSDISISSRAIRRFALMHSLISFIFNTIIVALTINTLASLND